MTKNLTSSISKEIEDLKSNLSLVAEPNVEYKIKNDD